MANVFMSTCTSFGATYYKLSTQDRYAQFKPIPANAVLSFVVIISTPIGDAILNSIHGIVTDDVGSGESYSCGTNVYEQRLLNCSGAMIAFYQAIVAAQDTTTDAHFYAGNLDEKSELMAASKMAITQSYIGSNKDEFGRRVRLKVCTSKGQSIFVSSDDHTFGGKLQQSVQRNAR
ncbi:Uu.00g131260.m01.CDS01 [Anthostomella pinea]|uniref:Uu.00g131260.m01.CDS01 n=1 Tax=Anthostomella pinea TaxID=933095 RepID=A0AAI8YID6_9PEZI|nr:Uu.00g131260.m01.CDS01 [Anthostomella pinea]